MPEERCYALIEGRYAYDRCPCRGFTLGRKPVFLSINSIALFRSEKHGKKPSFLPFHDDVHQRSGLHCQCVLCRPHLLGIPLLSSVCVIAFVSKEFRLINVGWGGRSWHQPCTALCSYATTGPIAAPGLIAVTVLQAAGIRPAKKSVPIGATPKNYLRAIVCGHLAQFRFSTTRFRKTGILMER